MTSDLAIFAARLRDFISLSMDEPLYAAPHPDPTWQAHSDAEFNGMALALFALQFKHNSAYRKLCEAHGLTPAAAHHWKQIPAVPTTAFKEFEMTCLKSDERTAVFHSSGTTEQKPSRHFHCADSLATYEASLWMGFSSCVATDVRRLKSKEEASQSLLTSAATFDLAILTPPPVQAPHSSLVHMFEVVRLRLGQPVTSFLGNIDADGTWSLDFSATLIALQSTINHQLSTLVLGTAFSFVHLLDFLVEKNLRLALPPGSRVLETGGYKNRSRSMPKAALHTLITERLGVPAENIICEYGMSELSSQAYAAPSSAPSASRLFHFPPWARVQIISPETGREVAEDEMGLIRIFDLANVYSVMAIQTEDLGIRRGDGFELFGRAAAAEPRGCSLMTA